MKKFFKYLVFPVFLLAFVVAGVGAYYAYNWSKTPVSLDNSVFDFHIKRGDTLRSVSSMLEREGILKYPDLLILYGRYTGQDRMIKAGAYEIKAGDTPLDVLERIASGDMSHRRIALIEGRTTKQFIERIQSNPDITVTLDPNKPEELLRKLKSPYESLEGLFYPDTYVFIPGDTDFDILRRAYGQFETYLQDAWDKRDPSIPLKNPYELLIMASIVEKETGLASDRDTIAGVFMNRLKANMLLQTDPTVIYGMGDKYEGRIRKVDLQTDTPWNTYTRKGLPPTPIANPGLAALEAASQPAQHGYYYFVSRGDGSSEFAENLQQHNRNVRRFILNKGE
ncbi:MAG: endolytic transglycosylase MltG [Alcaligenaceae bacterium]|nr:endolytic transglycosylase MltG [Alcaligenaceae bacterium]